MKYAPVTILAAATVLLWHREQRAVRELIEHAAARHAADLRASAASHTAPA